MSRSDAPCAPGRSSAGTAAVSRVDPATRVHDHPRPSRNRPRSRVHDSPSGEADASSAAADRIADPSTATARPPKRSTARPVSGEKANMPRMWMLMTKPMTSRSAPPWFMCSGVMTMTLTMTTCPSARVRMPRRALGMPAATLRPRVTEPWVAPESSPSATRRCRASMSGSGRSRQSRTAMASRSPSSENRNGPVSSGRPRARATGALGPTRLGPTTLPMVVAHTTMLRSRARCCGCARSAPAYLAWLLDAVAPPNSTLATRSSGKLRITPAVMRPIAPVAASR